MQQEKTNHYRRWETVNEIARINRKITLLGQFKKLKCVIRFKAFLRQGDVGWVGLVWFLSPCMAPEWFICH